MDIIELKQILENKLSREKADVDDYNRVKDLLRPMEGKKITKRIDRLADDFHYFKEIFWAKIKTSHKTYSICRLENMFYSEKTLDELNTPYSRGAPERIKQLEHLLLQDHLVLLTLKYDRIEESLKTLSELKGSFQDNPAHYEIEEIMCNKAGFNKTDPLYLIL